MKTLLFAVTHGFTLGLLSAYLCSCSLISSPTDYNTRFNNIEKSGPLHVSCSPDRTVIAPNQAVRLKVGVTTANGVPLTSNLKLSWTSTAGIFDTKKDHTLWIFENATPDAEYLATVNVKGPGGLAGECLVTVYVARSAAIPIPSRNLPRSSSRSFLYYPGDEARGFGLYSYVLFGVPPSNSEKKMLYKKIVQAYLQIIPESNELQNYYRSKKLNVTYLPITDKPLAKDYTSGNFTRWVFEHYDYTGARMLLNSLDGEYRDGIRIVAFLKPLRVGKPPMRPYLEMDLTGLTPDLAFAWMQEFVAQASQQRHWEERTIPVLRLRVRTSVAVLAKELPKVLGSLDEWISVLQKIPSGEKDD